VVEVELVDVRIEDTTKQPFMELRPLDGSGRILPIFIGLAEAGAIKAAVDGRTPPRPMTHDLFATTLTALGATLDQVVVTSFQQKVFYAELHLTVHVAGGDPAGRREVVSCRPSDGVALAVRTGAALYVNDAVMEECAVPDLTAAASVDEGELVDEFRRFIDDIRPDDFR
jgi:bifunctional DNase/RNase